MLNRGGATPIIVHSETRKVQIVADAKYDVIVVGAGNAALVAALQAHEAGAKVLVLEAAPKEERGGNSRFSGAIFRVVHNGKEELEPLLTEAARKWLPKIDVESYTADDYYFDIQDTSGGRADEVLTRRLIANSYETVAWMADKGVHWELTIGKLIDPANMKEGDTYLLRGGMALRAHHEGVGLVQNLFDAVEREGIEVWYGSPAHDLIVEGRTIKGVRVQQEDRFVDIEGVVVLGAGGFEANPELRERYLGAGWDLVKVRGTRFNMGAMLMRAMDAGAQSAGHWGGAHASPQDYDCAPVGDLAMTDKMSRYSYPYALMVNIQGQRFIDEGEDELVKTYAKTGAAIREQPQGKAFQIFDAKTVHLLEPRYETGEPIVADSLEELEKVLEIPEGALLRTVRGFNASTRDGRFDPFVNDGLSASPEGQPVKSNWALPLDTAPYTVYPVTCGITFTYGGLKIDEQARVIDKAGNVMPGLYATGELTGGFFFHNYPGGAGLVRGAVFGRIAGTNAAERAAKV